MASARMDPEFDQLPNPLFDSLDCRPKLRIIRNALSSYQRSAKHIVSVPSMNDNEPEPNSRPTSFFCDLNEPLVDSIASNKHTFEAGR